MKAVTIAETDRLILRHLQMDDLSDMAPILADPEVMRFSLGRKTREQTRKWMEGCLENYSEERWGFGLWAVVHKRDNKLIGYCGLVQWKDVDGRREVEVGYRLARPYWGRGLATEAARAVRDYAFGQLGLTRLISIIEPENIASIRVAEKNGMKLEKEIIKWNRPVRIYAVDKSGIAEQSVGADPSTSLG